ncbi:shikimate dehydrogenase [Klebsiella pneumoniae]|nr:shikimate dehydrogenase [Klebsiella pneumoniae]OSY23953.1 shikimate dehydrogenase [Klebsiella pneumoniae]
MVSGTTQVVAVIGHPIAQVKSPDNFNRYFAEQHMDSVMIPVDIAPDAVAAYLNALRGWQNMTGVLVTVPHKQRAAALVDDLTPRARRLNAVNVIRKLADGRLQGDMLDGVGFQLAAEAQGFQPAGKQALLSGCGLHDQTPATRQRLHDLLAEAFPAVQLSALPDTLYGLDLLVNGSPAGMAGFDELPLPQALLDTLDSTTHVADVVTAPVMTPLLTFAAARGCKVQTGPEMALAQMRLMGQFIGAIPQAQGAAA